MTYHLLQMSHLIDQAFHGIVHDLVSDVFRSEKIVRMQTAVLLARQESERKAKANEAAAPNTEIDPLPDVEIDSAIVKAGKIYIKGNPFKTVKEIVCLKCKLPRLMYPRVGFGAKDLRDANKKYCKNEPPIIVDKHDVHGQRKKGTKLKGQPKVTKKRKVTVAETSPPPASQNSEPGTPTTGSFVGPAADNFEYKTIEYPSVKCPHYVEGIADHWKAANLMASHLNGTCWLKRDRQAGRDAAAKLANTPRESRAGTPKPGDAVVNLKRKAIALDGEGSSKKRQKADTPKKNKKESLLVAKVIGDEAEKDDDDESIKNESRVMTVPGLPPISTKKKPMKLKKTAPVKG